MSFVCEGHVYVYMYMIYVYLLLNTINIYIHIFTYIYIHLIHIRIIHIHIIRKKFQPPNLLFSDQPVTISSCIFPNRRIWGSIGHPYSGSVETNPGGGSIIGEFTQTYPDNIYRYNMILYITLLIIIIKLMIIANYMYYMVIP